MAYFSKLAMRKGLSPTVPAPTAPLIESRDATGRPPTAEPPPPGQEDVSNSSPSQSQERPEPRAPQIQDSTRSREPVSLTFPTNSTPQEELDLQQLQYPPARGADELAMGEAAYAAPLYQFNVLAPENIHKVFPATEDGKMKDEASEGDVPEHKV